jgi:drug/metabolite transporter (DMT)-like permease
VAPFETYAPALYNFRDGSFLPEADFNAGIGSRPRRRTIFAAALLLVALALVVIYTTHSAFHSPLALVVVAAIGLAALLLQTRLPSSPSAPVRAPLSLNLLGVVCAVVAVFADVLRLSPAWMPIAALGAVICFGISGLIVLDALRKQRN